MIVLSLFDGISCGQIALNKLNIKYEKYISSEINKNSIKVTQKNYPNTIQAGDINNLKYINNKLYSNEDIVYSGKIDLLLAGSPCQSISKLGDGTGLNGKSGLFYEFLRLKNEVNPKYFLLENVVGHKNAINEITNLLNCNVLKIN